MEREQRNQDAIEEERTALMKLKEVDTENTHHFKFHSLYLSF